MNLHRIRKWAQVSALMLLVVIPVMNKAGITVVTGTLYSLAIGPLWITDPLIGLQTYLTTLTIDTKLLLSVLIPLLVAVMLGRVFCSWVCPQNLISEFVDSLAAQLGIKRPFRPRPAALPRYLVLAWILVLTTLVGLPLASLLSAPGIISVQISRVITEGAAGIELGLIGLIIIAEMFFVRRAWCNYACPIGGFLGLFRVRKSMKVAFREDREHPCSRCRVCVDACQLGLDPLGGTIYPLCHNCGDCIAACAEMKGREKPLVFRF